MSIDEKGQDRFLFVFLEIFQLIIFVQDRQLKHSFEHLVEQHSERKRWNTDI